VGVLPTAPREPRWDGQRDAPFPERFTAIGARNLAVFSKRVCTKVLRTPTTLWASLLTRRPLAQKALRSCCGSLPASESWGAESPIRLQARSHSGVVATSEFISPRLDEG